jgi:methanogenic corrinoid protein MtbC1
LQQPCRTLDGTDKMVDRSYSDTSAFRQAREALRLHKSVLPEDMVQLLADEVVQRLAGSLHPELAGKAIPAEVPVDQFCEALLSGDSTRAMQLVEQERQDGVSIEAVYLGTLASASRRLGEMWDEDRVSFLQMSVAAGRIFEIMRWLRSQIPRPSGPGAMRRHALFVTVLGEMHSIGVTMAADLFRNRGWEIGLLTGLDHEALMAAIQHEDFAIIGISAGNPGMVLPLTRLIVALRITHPGAHIVVSGPIVNQLPGLNALIRADTVIGDGADPIQIFEDLVQGA